MPAEAKLLLLASRGEARDASASMCRQGLIKVSLDALDALPRVSLLDTMRLPAHHVPQHFLAAAHLALKVHPAHCPLAHLKMNLLVHGQLKHPLGFHVEILLVPLHQHHTKLRNLILTPGFLIFSGSLGLHYMITLFNNKNLVPRKTSGSIFLLNPRVSMRTQDTCSPITCRQIIHICSASQCHQKLSLT